MCVILWKVRRHQIKKEKGLRITVELPVCKYIIN